MAYPEKMYCEICKFAEGPVNVDGMECHRHAPSPLVGDTINRATDEETKHWVIWPETAVYDWCGEFEQRICRSLNREESKKMVETAADIMAKDLPELPAGSKEFWCAYELKNGGIGTWCDYAMNADEFVKSVVNGIYGDIVQKFTEIHQHNDPHNLDGGYINIPVRKYNKFLRKRGGEHDRQ